MVATGPVKSIIAVVVVTELAVKLVGAAGPVVIISGTEVVEPDVLVAIMEIE